MYLTLLKSTAGIIFEPLTLFCIAKRGISGKASKLRKLFCALYNRKKSKIKRRPAYIYYSHPPSGDYIS